MVLVLYMVCSISLAVPGVEALFVNWKAHCLLASYTRSAAQKKRRVASERMICRSSLFTHDDMKGMMRGLRKKLCIVRELQLHKNNTSAITY